MSGFEILPRPEFGMDLVARAGDAVLKLLREDEACRGYFSAIVDTELEELVLSAAGDLPLLAVHIPETEETPETNDMTATLRIVVELLMLHSVPEAKSNSRWLRQRIVAHIGRLIHARNFGALEDDAGQITESLTRVARVPFRYRFVAGVVLTPIQLEFRSWKALQTGLHA